jgi:hypothetical protein
MSTISFQYALRLGHGFKKDSETIANQLRSELGLARHDRLNARILAKHLGMRVRYPEQLPSIGAAGIPNLRVAGEKQPWSAVLIEVAGYPGLIVTNPHQSLVREESNIFHELAHYLCRHEPIRIEMRGGLPFREFDKAQELQAEHLGYALHLNKDSLFYSFKNGLDSAAICTRYCASPQLVQHRTNLTQVKRILGIH